jgi:IS30 family transposase
LWDEAGNAYLPISQVAKALGKHKTTIYRWIEDSVLITEDGTPVVKEFSYLPRSGVQKLVQAVARSAKERYRSHEAIEARVIKLMRDSHQSQPVSAEREYRRLREQLEKHLGRKPEQPDIEDKLLDDPKVVRYLHAHQKRQAKRVEARMSSEDAISLDAQIEESEERLAEALLGSDQWFETLDALQQLRQLQQSAHP